MTDWMNEPWADPDSGEYSAESVLWAGVVHQDEHGMSDDLQDMILLAAMKMIAEQMIAVGMSEDTIMRRLFDDEPTFNISIDPDDGLQINAEWEDDLPGATISVVQSEDGSRTADVKLAGPTIRMEWDA